ncbi:hypothetical protein H4582DRAFT_2163098, partial [Lactarius indigo]
IAHPAFGHALWDPDPGQYPPVQVGDVGYIRNGKFHRLFNALLSADHPSHKRLGTPPDHEPLQLQVKDHIDRGTIGPNTFHSYGVNVGIRWIRGTRQRVIGLPILNLATVGSADVSFSCTKTQGAVLSLPVAARREDTPHLGHFRKWILRHIDSWYTFACTLEIDIQMEHIILVTGCHRSKSWTNTVFNKTRADARVSLGVDVGAFGANINWRVSEFRVQGAVHNRGPNGWRLPKNQCIFIRGFRVKRFFFGLVPRIRGAAEPKPDTRGDNPEPEKKVAPAPVVAKVRLLFFGFPVFMARSKYRDPLHVLLEYIAKVSAIDLCHIFTS